MIPILLSGGTGSRLWPLSRALYPKQFLPLHSDHTLFQDTLLRLRQMTNHILFTEPLVVCHEDHRFIAAESLRIIGEKAQAILLEPCGRNTAPAIAVSALMALKTQDDPVLLVLPADHIISDIESFEAALIKAQRLAQNGALVTFGIPPTIPHTGYGYIKCGAPIGDQAYTIAAFKEKPDKASAESFLKEGSYVWNSGMFVFKAAGFLEALALHQPEMLRLATQSVENRAPDLDFIRLERTAFTQCPALSVDHAVMEHTRHGAVVMLEAGWNDIGSWDSLWDISEKDESHNVCKGDILAQNSHNNYLYSEKKLLCTLGVDDLIVVDTPDATLVARRDQTQSIKNLVETLIQSGRHETRHHRTVYRPWGHYDLICAGARDQVKRITVSPGAKLSVQYHRHRAEHWVVVKGRATVRLGDDIRILSENESLYVPVGTVHALENAEQTPLEIIEIQTGDYLGEDDIVRLEDRYGRA